MDSSTFNDAYKANANVLSEIFGMDFLQLDEKQVQKLKEYEDLKKNLEYMQQQYQPPPRTGTAGQDEGGAASQGQSVYTTTVRKTQKEL